MGEVVLVVAPVAPAFAEPVAVVEAAIRVVLVADLDVRPRRQSARYPSHWANWLPSGAAIGPKAFVPAYQAPEDRHDGLSGLGEHFLGPCPAAEIEADSVGERHAPLEAVLAVDEREDEVGRQVLAVIRVGLRREGSTRSRLASAERFRPTLPEIVEADGGSPARGPMQLAAPVPACRWTAFRSPIAREVRSSSWTSDTAWPRREPRSATCPGGHLT